MRYWRTSTDTLARCRMGVHSHITRNPVSSSVGDRVWGLPQRQAAQENSSVSAVTTQFISVYNVVVAVAPYRGCSLQDQHNWSFPGVLAEEGLLQQYNSTNMIQPLISLETLRGERSM